MVHTNLIVALVFAALFGAVLIWLAIYYIHRYIHLRCLELDHWFHLLTPPHWHTPCRHCEGTGRSKIEKSRSRSSKRRERSRGRGRRERCRHERVGYGRGQRMIEADAEWNGNGQGHQMQRPRQTLPMSPAMQTPGVGEYGPWPSQWQWQGQMPGAQQFAQPAMHPQAFPQMYPQAFQQAYGMPQKQAMPDSSYTSSVPPYQKSSRKVQAQRSDKEATTSKQVPKDSSRVRKTDYIHIVDDYPPIVKEAIKKAAPKPPPSPTSLTGSSASTEPAEEVPRTSIPQATPRFGGPPLFPFLSNPTPVFDTPQWNGNEGRPNKQARYALPYARPQGRMGIHVETDRRCHVSSNTSSSMRGMAAA
jgi:hypothetical protein